MQTPAKTIVDLERKFWQSMVEQDADAALDMLCEPALMVSPRGAMKFDHDEYRKMAEQGAMVLTAFELQQYADRLPEREHRGADLPRETEIDPAGRAARP